MKRHDAAAFLGGVAALALGLYWAGGELARQAEALFELDTEVMQARVRR